MPFILIIIGVIAALGLGGFLWKAQKQEDAAPLVTPVATTTETPVATEPTAVTPTTTTPGTTPTPDTVPTPTSVTTAYKNGTYTADVTYVAPDRLTHPVHVLLTIAGDIVTASDITFGSEVFGTTAVRQTSFAAAYKTLVVGQPLGDINLSRVGGSSLTTGAFNAAKAKIIAEAKAS